jgi:hypothetical protein
LVKSIPKTVKEIGRIKFSGNIIPKSWYHSIKTESGKPDLIAITLLADIVYWYRPAEIRKNNTGKIIGYRKKFNADMLQRTNRWYVDEYGFSKKQVQRAIRRLKNYGLIKCQLRTIPTQTGVLYNVQFIEPVPKKIRQITLGRGMDNFGGTNTENTTKEY